MVWAPNTQIDRDIVITEVDIDNLIRAKGAMYAGYVTLLEEVGLTMKDLEAGDHCRRIWKLYEY